MARRNAFLLLALAQTTALKVFGTPGRGPAIQRVYPADNSVKVEYWLGAGQLTSCTVDDVRGLQKCNPHPMVVGSHSGTARRCQAASSSPYRCTVSSQRGPLSPQRVPFDF